RIKTVLLFDRRELRTVPNHDSLDGLVLNHPCVIRRWFSETKAVVEFLPQALRILITRTGTV
ncbi:MAG TPA: hypothetical protein VKY40_11115, partial [Halanaerobiales bacterium]|nr:hypothetical protein [Halanaerobiales bacterium]